MNCKRMIVLAAVTAATMSAQCYQFTGSGATIEIDISDFTLKNGPTFSSGGGYASNDRFEGSNTLIVGSSTKTSKSTANSPDCAQCEIGTVTLSYSAGALTVFTMTVPTNTEPSEDYWGVTLGGTGNLISSGILPQPAAFPPVSSWNANAEITVAVNGTLTEYPITAIGACSGSTSGGGSGSETTSVTVNGNQGPWLQTLNPTFDYGDGSNMGPTVVSASSGISFTPGGTITVTYASGQVNVYPEGGFAATDANGYSGDATNNQVLANGSYPSYFMNASSYPVYASELAGAFANNGVIVGTPFPVGDGPASFVIPEGANQLLLGVDDNDYTDNTGSWTLNASYAPLVVSHVLNGASYQPGIVPGSLATIYGTNLSPVTDSWDKYIVDGKYPTTLDGVTVTVGGKPAYLSYISSAQINLIVPEIGTGTQPVVVKNSVGASAAFSATVSSTGPAFLLWPKNQAVATLLNYTLAAESGTFAGATTAPAKPGDVVILWGTGFGPTIPADPVGEETPSKGTYSTSTMPKVTLNNATVTVYGAALASGDGGLYQIAIQVPSSLGDGVYPIQATIGGVTSPTGVMLAVQQ